MGKRRHLSEKARAWKDEAILVMRNKGDILPDGDLCIGLDLYPPKNGRKPDVDGPIKLAMDAVAAAYGIDDYRFVDVRARRFPVQTGLPEGRLDVTVWQAR